MAVSKVKWYEIVSETGVKINLSQWTADRMEKGCSTVLPSMEDVHVAHAHVILKHHNGESGDRFQLTIYEKGSDGSTKILSQRNLTGPTTV